MLITTYLEIKALGLLVLTNIYVLYTVFTESRVA